MALVADGWREQLDVTSPSCSVFDPHCGLGKRGQVSLSEGSLYYPRDVSKIQ